MAETVIKDVDKNLLETTTPTTTALQQSKEILRECKPSENISINNSPPKSEKLEILIPDSPSANTETVFEKFEIADRSSSDSAVIEEEKTKVRQPDRNKSDIFSLDDKIQSANTIFSVNGTPSGRINRRRDEHSEVFPVGCMGCKEQSTGDPRVPTFTLKESQSRPVSGKFSNRHRNPLTGAGVDSTDEIKRGVSGRRKDGNPVLGLGYDSGSTVTPSSTRVPPGGYSKGLW